MPGGFRSRIILHHTLVNMARTRLFNAVGDRIHIVASTGEHEHHTAAKLRKTIG